MNKNNLQSIVLGGGCFWCVEAIFQEIIGVKEVVSGYAGGFVKNPDYDEVSGGATGHAEVIKIVFDEKEISLGELLEIFFAMHDPTILNRQGNDVGSQYRSVILYTKLEQKDVIEKQLNKSQQDFESKIVTEVKPLEKFYKAENYHLNYYNKNKNAIYCQMVISPKLKKLRDKFKKKVI